MDESPVFIPHFLDICGWTKVQYLFRTLEIEKSPIETFVPWNLKYLDNTVSLKTVLESSYDAQEQSYYNLKIY